MVASNSSGESGVSWDNGRWNGTGGQGAISQVGLGILGCIQGWGGLGCCRGWVWVLMGLRVLWQGLDLSLGADREGKGSCGGGELAAVC